jgi:CHAT domain-containing protein
LLVRDGQVDATVLGGYQPEFAKTVVDRYFTGEATRDLQHFAYEALIEYVGMWLWDLLEPEVSSRVADGDGITFVLTGLFANLPLQAAYAREHDSQPGLRRYLSEKYVLRVAPKLGVLRHQPGSCPASPWALVVSDPWPSSATALRWTRAESETIARLYPGSAALRGARASKARVMAGMPQVPVVHFACHGVFREPVEASGILLRNDEILSASDVAGVRLAPGTVVILSACDLGFVAPTSDEGIGVPATLLCAGASSVVASLWACDDLAAAVLMAEFHQILAVEQTAPAPALQLAQHRLRHNELTSPLAPQAAGHNFSHPRFWASFACFGR